MTWNEFLCEGQSRSLYHIEMVNLQDENHRLMMRLRHKDTGEVLGVILDIDSAPVLRNVVLKES